METSTRISFAAIFAALVVVAFCFSACPSDKQGVNNDDDDDAKWKFNLQFHGTSQSEAYLLVNKPAFDEALCNLDKQDPNTRKKKGFYKVEFKPTATASATPDYKPECATVGSIRTEKVTRSEIAGNASADASAANDPNATQRVRAANLQDLKSVLDAFIEPSPTPTPGG
jgi:hypothetical protein